MIKRVAIIGGSSGIGLHLAKRLKNENFEIIIASRSSKKLQIAKEELGNGLKTYQLDANKEAEVIAFSEKIGSIDHLIITLRGTSVTGPFINSNIEDVRKAFDEKFWTQYNVVRHCYKNIKPNGSIILASGIASQRSYPGFYWQSCANGAIESLAKSLSTEIAPIRINVISPGFVESKFNDVERLNNIMNIEPKLPMKRLATHDEIAEGYLFLMKSSYSTGTTLTIDGGVLSV